MIKNSIIRMLFFTKFIVLSVCLFTIGLIPLIVTLGFFNWVFPMVKKLKDNWFYSPTQRSKDAVLFIENYLKVLDRYFYYKIRDAERGRPYGDLTGALVLRQ